MVNNCKPISLLVVDDHDSVRRTINFTLQVYDDIQWVGEAVNGAEAVTLYLEIQPDVILMDLQMPKMDGITAISMIRQQCSEVKIIAFSSFGEQSLVKVALEAGANTYLSKNVSMDELADTIRSVSVNSLSGISGGSCQTDG